MTEPVDRVVPPERTRARTGAGPHRARGRSRTSLHRRSGRYLRRFWQLGWKSNITGNSAMVAYNMLLGVVPIALLALFIAGQVLRSSAVQSSVLTDLQEVFPGSTEHTLNSLLGQIRSSTTSTGVLALIASLWLASSFWGALDTAFSRIYGCSSRRWIDQKRFGLVMVGVVLLFMVATVAVPIGQSILETGASKLPFDLARVADLVYVIGLVVSLTLLFVCLSVIYSRVPNRSIPWRSGGRGRWRRLLQSRSSTTRSPPT